MNKQTKMIAAFVGIAIFFLYLLKLMPLIEDGAPIQAAALTILVSTQFWLYHIVPFAIMIIPVMMLLPVLHRRMTAGGSGQNFNWRKAARTYTFMGVLLLLFFGYLLARPFFDKSGSAVRWDQFLTLALLWAGYAFFVIYRFFMKPDKDMIKAYETGDESRFNDERQQLIGGKSAVSTLYALIAIIFFAGFLFDILVTRIWPLRSLTEIILIVVIWYVNSRRWSKVI